jgi:hypothetical protein
VAAQLAASQEGLSSVSDNASIFKVLFDPDDGGSTFLQNFTNDPLDYMASHPGT